MDGINEEDARWFELNYDRPYYKVMENKFCKPLSDKDIISAFKNECLTIIPRIISEIEDELEDLKQEKAIFKNKALFYFTKQYAEELSENIMPKEKLTRLQSLKGLQNMLDCGDKDNGKYTEEQIEQARNVDIRTLYTFNKSRTYGNRYTACCPFHKNGNENTPSFMIFPRGNYNCFGCGKKGNNAIDFIMELKGVKFNNAVGTLLRK